MPNATITMRLHRDIDVNQWYLDKVEATSGTIKTTTSCMVPMPLSEAFAPEVHDFLVERLPVRSDLAVCSIDSCQFNSIDLLLRNVRIIAQRAIAGQQSVTVRSTGRATDVARLYGHGIRLEGARLSVPGAVAASDKRLEAPADATFSRSGAVG